MYIICVNTSCVVCSLSWQYVGSYLFPILIALLWNINLCGDGRKQSVNHSPPLPIHPMCVIKGGSKLCRSISLLRKLKLETNQPVWSAWYIKSNRWLVKRLLPSFGINLVISTRVYQAFTEDESTSQVLSNHFVAKHHVNEVKNLQFPSYAILIKRNIATHS